MAIEVGNVFEGRVTGVKPFGAFVALPEGRVAKASELSGTDGWLFYRDSVTGAVAAKPRAGRVELNAALHAN